MRFHNTFLLHSSTFLLFIIISTSGESYYDRILGPDANNGTGNTLSGHEIYVIRGEGKIFRGLFRKNVYEIAISNSSITEVEDGAFCVNNTGLRALKIYGNDVFPNIDGKMFGNCPDLEELILENVTITDPSLFRNHPKLRRLSLLSDNFTEIDEIPSDIFANLTISAIVFFDISPRKIGDNVFSSSSLTTVMIGSYGADNSPELSENALQNLNGVEKLVLINANLTNFKWPRMERLNILAMDGPWHINHDFFKTIKENFPRLRRVKLNPKYFTGIEVAAIETCLKIFKINLTWSSQSGYF